MTREERERNLYTHVCFASIASGISLILSLVVMLRYNYRTNLEIDYLGAIVAILSLAVAIFVGVQIYQSFNLRRDIDDQNKKLLSDAKGSFSNSLSVLDRKIDKLNNDLENKYNKCVSYVDEQIQKERNKDIMKDLFQMALENMNRGDYWTSFYGFCNIVYLAIEQNEPNFRDRSIEWAINISESHQDGIKMNVKKGNFDSILSKLKNVNTNEARELVKFIEDNLPEEPSSDARKGA